MIIIKKINERERRSKATRTAKRVNITILCMFSVKKILLALNHSFDLKISNKK